MTRVKICGIRRLEDGIAVAQAGADALGLVFYPPSPRFVELPVAAEIAVAVGPLITTVALFVNPEPAYVREVLATVNPHVLQFHGDETPAFCEQFHHPYLKAIRVRKDTDIDAATAPYGSAAAFLFDAWHDKLYGGTGETFDWHRIRGFDRAPVILAGGLTPENVAAAIALTTPYAVDVSGGVEFSPGVKDAELVRRFVANARQIVLPGMA